VELERLVFSYEADAIVFDGNNPTPGIVSAALAQPPCKLVWVRRGMNGAVASPYLDNSRHFDLIIEPGEIAAVRDSGATAARRHEALHVDPVTLLDPEDLLVRDEAQRLLGLDPARPAVLVQLGAGAHRDVVSLLDKVVRCLREFEDLQIVIAEWANASAPLSLWPETIVVSGYPLSRYLPAFDFCISAAGYNTFHEAIAFGMPTVFIATTHVAVDDQKGRARYAQDMGAALELSEDQLYQLPAICSVMLDARAREVLRQKCALLRRPNGALAAADAIAELLGAA
jgi:UDP:flavonoid glycosyltransferase YjiC (YdhE family)